MIHTAIGVALGIILAIWILGLIGRFQARRQAQAQAEPAGYRTDVYEITSPEAEASARKILSDNQIPITSPRGLTQAEIDMAKSLAMLMLTNPPPGPKHPLNEVMGALSKTPEELAEMMTDFGSMEFVGSPVELVGVTDPRHPAHEVWAGKRRPPTVEEMRQWLA